MKTPRFSGAHLLPFFLLPACAALRTALSGGCSFCRSFFCCALPGTAFLCCRFPGRRLFRRCSLRGGFFCCRPFCRSPFRCRFFRSALLCSAFFRRHFCPFLSCFGQADGNCLFSGRYFFPATATFQFTFFHFMHGSFYFFASTF